MNVGSEAGTVQMPPGGVEETRAADLEALALRVNQMLASRRPVRRETKDVTGADDRTADLEALALQVNRMIEKKRPVQSVGAAAGGTGLRLLRRVGRRMPWAR
jgi:hypothetical protein